MRCNSAATGQASEITLKKALKKPFKITVTLNTWHQRCFERDFNMKHQGAVSTTQLSQIPVKLALRSDLHLARKAWHLIMGLTIVAVYLISGMSRTTGVLILGSVLGLDLIMELTRLRVPAVNQMIMKRWGLIMRSHEANCLSTIPYYLSAAILAIAIFPKPIAALSLLYLACGDPIASLFGILYGDKSVRFKSGKSLIGTLAGVGMCAVVTFLFLSALGMSADLVLLLTFIGGIAGGTAELVPLEVDDNFSIPIVSGFILWLAFILIGI